MLRIRHHPLCPRLGATALLVAALLASVGAACTRTAPQPAGVIDREVFIAAWVDLRLAALQAPDRRLPVAERARVLREHDVTEEELLAFAEAHGSDIELMKAVWDEVDRRFKDMRPRPDPSMPS
jgi:hypothetical protein